MPRAGEPTEREQILFTLACLAPLDELRISRANRPASWETLPRWEMATSANPPKRGDVVRCASSITAPHGFTIGRVVEVASEHELLLREIGGKRLCRVSNEMFTILRGVRSMALLEGRQRRYAQRVVQAFRKIDRFDAILLDVEFPEEERPTEAIVSFRAHAFVRASREDPSEIVRAPISFAPVLPTSELVRLIRRAAPWIPASEGGGGRG